MSAVGDEPASDILRNPLQGLQALDPTPEALVATEGQHRYAQLAVPGKEGLIIGGVDGQGPIVREHRTERTELRVGPVVLRSVLFRDAIRPAPVILELPAQDQLLSTEAQSLW
jgi:hypothetical protein